MRCIAPVKRRNWPCALFFTGYDTCLIYGQDSARRYVLAQDRARRYVLAQDRADAFEGLLRNSRKEEASAWLAQMAEGLLRCPATDESYVRHILFQFAGRIYGVAQERGISLTAEGNDPGALRQSFFSGGFFPDLYAVLCDLLDHLFSKWDAMCQNRPVYLVRQFIEQNYADSTLSIQDIADSVHLTPSHICHIFKKETGQTVNQYMTSLRIEKAKLLLRRPDIRLASVTEQIGYTDTNYFTRQFKKEEFFANRELADAAVARPEVWVSHKLGEETYSFGAIQIKGSDWQLISVIPYSEIRAASNAIRMQMVFIMAVIALCAWIAAYLVADSITRRINLLTKHIKKVQEGDFSVIVNMKGSDEISELAHNYNYMLEQLERYARLQFQSGADLKAAELKALQAQINPHFLYNTLELINWMALTKNAPEISEIVQALAKFYKLSLSRGRDEIPIRDELAHIETYVQLQNYRYENRIRLNLEVDPSLYEYRILKLILQPVVENAILHGILESEQCQGTITVCGAMAGGDIMLTVEDDGIGMTPQQMAVMLGEAPAPIKRPGHGYGISNVIKRIHLYYGEKYGIRCESEPGSGSRVIISIAAIQEGIQEPGPR
ncbi:HAMP domain-containing protein [Lachnotalea sp. AF33-28]|nr:HAMP domain-containing protein [Lachnotalea sp. AF33-28]